MTTSLPRARAIWLAAALSALTALLLPAAAAAGAWSDPFRISPPAFDDVGTCGGPATSIADDGRVTYVWCQRVPTGPLSGTSALQSRIYRADGTVGEPRNVTDPGDTGFLGSFAVADDGSGGVHVAYLRVYESCSPFCSFGYDLEHVELDAEGQPVGTPQLIDSVPIGDDSIGGVDIDVNASGEALVGWHRYDGTADEGSAVAARIDADGAVGPDIDLDEGGGAQMPVVVALADSGDAFAAWSTSGSGSGAAGRAIDASTGPLPIRTLLPDDRMVNSLDALIDESGNGTAIVSQYNAGFTGFDTLARRVAASGDLVGAEPLVVAGGDDSPSTPSVAISASGAITLVWSQGGYPYDLRSRVIDTAGSLGTVNPLADDVDADYPLVALSPDGSGYVMVRGYDGDDDLETIEALAIDPDGSANGAFERIGAEADEFNYLYPASIAVRPGGTAAVAWFEEIDDVDGESEAHGAIFDGTPPDADLWSPAKATPGEPVIVAATGGDRSGVSYSWTFGDGGTGAGQVASHAYAKPGSYTISLTAEDGAGNAVTVQAPIQVLAPGGGGSGDGDARDVTPPDTRILGGPAGRTRNRRPRFRFVASEPGAAFECKVDRGRWKACESRQRLKRLRFGRHTFQVRAVDAADNADRFPDSRRFQVVKPKRKKRR